MQGYDIIGDIHGYAGPLRELLGRLGYREDGGSYAHPQRKVIFLGDYVDRGPAIREVLQVVRAMTDSGAALALMGNHEFNALTYSTPDGKGGFLRPHTARNTRLRRATLEQIAGPHPEEWRGWLDWFRTLPLALDLGKFRAAHAGWSNRAVALVKDLGPLTEATLARMADKTSPLGRAREILINGLELALPPGCFYLDRENDKRTDIRTRWWLDLRGMTYREAVLPDVEGVSSLLIRPDRKLRDHSAYPASAPPVFNGHYWLPPVGAPALQARNVAILDYSVAGEGMLVAYRWDGEQELDAAKFVTVWNRRAASRADADVKPALAR
jgi:hypothetical protein